MNQPSVLKPVNVSHSRLSQSKHNKRDVNQKFHKAWTHKTIQSFCFTCLSVFGVRAAKPQSDKWGLSSSSSKILADLKFLCTTEGKQTSCKYLSKQATVKRGCRASCMREL
jgi:hypothetical protein